MEIRVVIIIIHFVVSIRLRLCSSLGEINGFAASSSSVGDDVARRDRTQVIVASFVFLFFFIVYCSLTRKLRRNVLRLSTQRRQYEGFICWIFYLRQAINAP